MLFIETESRRDIKERPDSLTGIKPSRIEFHHVPFDVPVRVEEVMIYDNDTKGFEYKIGPFINTDGLKNTVSLSPSYNWLPDQGWAKVSKENVGIEAGGREEVSLDV